MKTLEQVYDIVEGINEIAHGRAFDAWMAADAEDDEEAAEELEIKPVPNKAIGLDILTGH